MMYSWEKSLIEEKSRKNPKNPSFSSSLLDEIFRSIDGNEEKSSAELRVIKERSVKKYSCSSSSNGGILKAKVEDEEMASLKRACLIQKWMEKKVNDNLSSRRRPSSLPEMDNNKTLLLQDNDTLFFSSTSSSSDSSSGGLSSSDTEFFSSTKSRKSCFTAPWPKPVRTSVFRQQGDEFSTFEEYKNQQTTKDQETLIKSKSRASKIYANLKKVKQPISPGGRLTSFINSLFTNGNTKKSKNNCSNGGYENAHIERKSKSTQASTCSSASSFSRSCLSKTPPSTRGKLTDGGTKRTVRFYPVSVIVDEDCRPCGHKSIYDDDDADSNKYGRPPLPQNAKEQKLHQIQKSTRKFEGVARETLRTFQNQSKEKFNLDRKICHEDEDDDFDDGASDSSSDLFEIDHLALFGDDRFREELPVYETTHLDTNLAIASGLIR